MNITSANQSSGVMPTGQTNQSKQDSHEKNIQNQIVSLQGKMRDLAYDTEMSTDEKSDKKKKLQEQIQNLNSELKQYQIQKRREEAEKRQKETDKGDENIKSFSSDKSSVKENAVSNTANSTVNSADNSNSATENNNIGNTDNSQNIDNQAQADEQDLNLNGTESEVMFSISNTKRQFANMEKIQTNLTGLMRTAETDEEKLKLQKKIDSISNIIEDKAKKTADKLAESREEDQKKKKKIREMLKEQEARKANMKAAVPKSGKSVFEDNEYGKVLLTRKKS